MASPGRAVSPPPDGSHALADASGIDVAPRTSHESAIAGQGLRAGGHRTSSAAAQQMEQDLDAARQMSRARAGSNAGAHHSPLSPRVQIPYGTRRPSHTELPEPALEVDTQLDPSRLHHSTSPHRAYTFATGTSPAAYRQHQEQREAAAAAAHFYQQRRHGSNTSLDSANHFIDHRSNQAFGPHAGSYVASPSRLQATGSLAFGGSGSRTFARSGLRSPSGLRAQDESALVDTEGPPVAGLSPTDVRGDHGVSTPHTMSRRPSALEDDVCFPLNAHTAEGQDLLRDGSAATPRHALGPHSHAPGMAENEEDLHCEPHDDQRLPPGYPFNFDLSALEDFAREERERLTTGAAPPVTFGTGLRNRHAAMRSQSGADNYGSTAYGASPDSDDATFYSRRPRRFVPADAAAAQGKGGPETAAGGSKYQRKLALFEGSATSPPPPAVGGRATTVSGAANIMGSGALMTEDAIRARQANQTQDAKTPLLGDPPVPSYTSAYDISPNGDGPDGDGPPKLPRSQSMGANFDHGHGRGALSAAQRRRSGAGFGSRSTAEKPYRFTFYSNALPSTIHARHLAELPAPGQTFEELFSGISPASDSEGVTRNQTPAEGDDVGMNGGANASATGTGSSKLDINGKDARPLRQTSVLAAQLGRMEGGTQPPTGRNTPELSAGPLPAAPLSAGNQSTFQRVPTMTSAARNSQAMLPARVAPGGGIRMDQDPEANTWWLDVLCPTDQEMKLLSRVFGIHPLTTEDILMEETREKIELFRNYYLVCFRSFDQDPYSPTYLEPLNMYIIVFREGTLSFHFRATPHPQNVRRRIKQLKDYINVTSDWISYALIDDITDAFGPLIQSIEYEVDSIDELVLILKEAEQSDMLRRIGTCRKKVMGLLRLMGNKADVVKGLAKRCNENWSVAPKSDIGLYLSDIQDHLITMTQNLNHYEKILSRSHSNYLAQISIEMTDANNQINDVLSKLTALGTVIVPMNIITGLWGMNVNVPGQDQGTLAWFFGIIGVMVFLAVVGYMATIRFISK
ncbi:cora-domain-containing protein [Ceraceosorus guamensis]|uniref:Cora-domain-containing protein n=1 Tax=Ceraceosorus guamensis TaxID=1522189 RepID=A0A316W8B2_9BASI|nr:cora-domain-containing protein [Ceraceosorus guamensis]PWN46072.1 cora-domain-containing protein [Ceraceosorus guamensis]